MVFCIVRIYPELQAAPTPPALINQNDNLDGPLNEHDDGPDLDEVNQGEEHLVLAQFDMVYICYI